MKICAQLNIPFLTFDFEKEYKKEVADCMIEEYKKGRTPNPDVMCNKNIKFGAFLDKAKEMGADTIATGHYARLETTQINADKKPQMNADDMFYKMYAGVDKEKDQSYFLWTLNQEQLKYTLFPVGDLEKSEVRKIAKENNLATAKRKIARVFVLLGKFK